MSAVAFNVGAVRARFSALDRPTAFFDAPGGTQAPDSLNEAMAGFMGTLITGIIASAIIAIFVRSRPDRIRARPHLPS